MYLMEAMLIWDDGQVEIAEASPAASAIEAKGLNFKKICTLGSGILIFVEESANAEAPLAPPAPVDFLSTMTEVPPEFPRLNPPRFSGLNGPYPETVPGASGLAVPVMPRRPQNPSHLQTDEAGMSDYNDLPVRMRDAVILERFLAVDEERAGGTVRGGNSGSGYSAERGCVCIDCRATRAMRGFVAMRPRQPLVSSTPLPLPAER